MRVRLKAKVKHITGKTVQALGTIVEGTPSRHRNFHPPAWVEIVEEDNAFYLLYFAADGRCMTDTWHPTLDEAKQQASLEFEICEQDWQTV